MLDLVKDWSEADDKLLESSRLAMLEGEKDSLSLKTAGYHWFMQNKSGTDKIIRINPAGKYTVSESKRIQFGKSYKYLGCEQ